MVFALGLTLMEGQTAFVLVAPVICTLFFFSDVATWSGEQWLISDGRGWPVSITVVLYVLTDSKHLIWYFICAIWKVEIKRDPLFTDHSSRSSDSSQNKLSPWYLNVMKVEWEINKRKWEEKLIMKRLVGTIIGRHPIPISPFTNPGGHWPRVSILCIALSGCFQPSAIFAPDILLRTWCSVLVFRHCCNFTWTLNDNSLGVQLKQCLMIHFYRLWREEWKRKVIICILLVGIQS